MTINVSSYPHSCQRTFPTEIIEPCYIVLYCIVFILYDADNDDGHNYDDADDDGKSDDDGDNFGNGEGNACYCSESVATVVLMPVVAALAVVMFTTTTTVRMMTMVVLKSR